jgi:hypothetical protein
MVRNERDETVQTPPERIIRLDLVLHIFNPKLRVTGKHVVDLACGHKAITRNRKTTICPRCSEMLRRSIEDGSEDWDSYRHRGGRDTMTWPADPMRQFNEELDQRDA